MTRIATTKQVQTKISSFFKPTKEKEIIMRLFTLEVSAFVFVYRKINLQHKFSINNHQWKFSYILLIYFFPLGTSMSSPPSTKKRVGRPTKLYTSDQVRDMIAKYDNFYEMVDFSKKYDQLFEIHCKWSVPSIVRLATEILRLFTQKKKDEKRFHDSIKGIYCETARAFDINGWTVREIIDAHPLPDKKKLSSKCNFPGAGRTLTYPIEQDNELIHFFKGVCIFQFPVSRVFKWKQSLWYNIITRPLMQVEVGLETFSTGTNLLYVPVFRSAKNCQSKWKVFLANSMKMLHVLWELESIHFP